MIAETLPLAVGKGPHELLGARSDAADAMHGPLLEASFVNAPVLPKKPASVFEFVVLEPPLVEADLAILREQESAAAMLDYAVLDLAEVAKPSRVYL